MSCRRFCIGSLLTLCLVGCSDEDTPQRASTTVSVPESRFVLDSTSGCLIDDDCRAGLFCFQGRCSSECAADAECRPGERCSAHGRCLDLEKERTVWKASNPPLSTSLKRLLGDEEATGSEPPPDWDEESAAAVGAQASQVKITVPPLSEIQVPPGTPFVEVSLETEAPVPDGAVLYRVELGGAGSARSLRAEGERQFKFQIPTGTAGSLDQPSVQRVDLVTSVGGFPLTLVPAIGLTGLYAGDLAVRELGGAGVPIRFGLRVGPRNATWENATSRSLLLPVSDGDLFSPVSFERGAPARWIERPVEWDDQGKVWFARFAAPFSFGVDSQFAGGAQVVRALRVEISGFDQQRLLGAVADRWLGLFSTRTADGVPTPATVGLSGALTAFRMGPLPAEAAAAETGSASAERPPVGAPLPVPACSTEVFGQLLAEARATHPGTCAGIGHATAFLEQPSAAKAACALALADQALLGPSTSAQVRDFLDEETPNPGGLSFEEFLQRCAARQGYCEPVPALECTEQLLAHAYQTQGAELPDAGALLERFQKVAREGYLGRQLAAFQVDTATRLEWLKTSEAPLFLAAELKAYNEEILARWKAQVLDAHFDVLARQLSHPALEVLARQPTEASALSARGQMLLELAQTWQGAMESLQIATARWGALYQDTASREQAAALSRAHVFDLYVSAAVLSQLNRAAGMSVGNSVFGSGFAALTRSLETLSLPFNDLVFMRDAEVVVSRSVDPSSSSQTLLADREELARRAVADAQDSVDRVLADVHTSQVTARVLTDRMLTQSEELRSELVQLCGLPQGCTVTDLDTRPECAVRVEAGRCGFSVHPTTGEIAPLGSLSGQPSVSEAGQALLKYQEAALEKTIAEEEFRANQERAQIELQSAEAFARKLEEWDQKRRETVKEVYALIDEMTRLDIAAMAQEGAAIREATRLREAAYDVQAKNVARFATLRSEGIDADMERLTQITALNQTSAWLSERGDEIDHFAEAIANGYPKLVGTSNDVSFVGRLAVGLSAFGGSAALRGIALALDSAAAGVQDALTEQQARREAQLEHLSDLAELGVTQTENEIERLAGNLRMHEMESAFAISTCEAIIDSLRRELEIDLAHERELVELRDRRDKVMLRLTESAALQVQIARAEVVAGKALLEYLEVVQRAQLLDGRYRALSGRLENLTELIGSPAVVFAFANRLARAESRVERAKTLLYDWLVALEYYAVRPFIDQRLAILLARNPSQLEAIANELVRLQRSCGGMVNREVGVLSVRDDLLQLGFDTDTKTAAERFRAVLARGNVPIDTQVRYSSDERIGELVSSRKVLAATFTLRLESFANLPLTCNAKLASVDVQLGGEGLGSARPTVSLLYDGTSSLRSCQPDVDTLVAGLDPGSTAFGSRTTFRTAGRSISPVANVNGFGAEDSVNRGLEGLPLASTYTLLIDPAAGENRAIDWGRLEDVKLRLEWAYQDVFPVGQCQ